MKAIIFSDIHANLTAFKAVLTDINSKYTPDLFISLGDLIDYGMRSNEIIEEIKKIDKPILANLRGNHEKAIVDGELSKFSSERGKIISRYTKNHLTDESISYIKTVMEEPSKEIYIKGNRILLLHGDIKDPYWGKLIPEKTNDEMYREYDYVFSGHTHIPFKVEVFFEDYNPTLRNQKKTVFINPGSVGQPRNLNANAQYVFIDFVTGETHFNSVPYNIEVEQNLFPIEIDTFYSERLKFGI